MGNYKKFLVQKKMRFNKKMGCQCRQVGMLPLDSQRTEAQRALVTCSRSRTWICMSKERLKHCLQILQQHRHQLDTRTPHFQPSSVFPNV